MLQHSLCHCPGRRQSTNRLDSSSDSTLTMLTLHLRYYIDKGVVDTVEKFYSVKENMGVKNT
jgi:hypothetical protein